jgi:hypothetical protein
MFMNLFIRVPHINLLTLHTALHTWEHNKPLSLHWLLQSLLEREINLKRHLIFKLTSYDVCILSPNLIFLKYFYTIDRPMVHNVLCTTMSPHDIWCSNSLTNIFIWVCLIVLKSVICLWYPMVFKFIKVYTNDTWL